MTAQTSAQPAPPALPDVFREALAVALLVVTHLGLLVHCCLNKSICYDEGAHLSAGIAYLRYGEFGIYNLSPPTARMLGALPVYLLEPMEIPPAKPMIGAPPGSRAWAYYDLFQEQNLDRLHRMVVLARLFSLPVSLLGAILIWWTSRGLFGRAAGLLSLALWSLSPSALAYGSTFGTDMPMAVTALAATLAWIRFFKNPVSSRCLIAAALTAAACLVKYSGVLLFPLILLLAALVPSAIPGWRPRIRAAAVGLSISVMITYVALCASFGFRLFGEPLGKFVLQSSLMQRIQAILPEQTPLPFPRYLVEGFDMQKWEAESVYANVLFGEGYFGSDWRYFPLHAFCKATLGGVLIGVLVTVSFTMRRPNRIELGLIALAVLFAGGMVVLTQINMGATRYLLPAYPPLMILAGRMMSAGLWGRAGRLIGMVVFVALGAAAMESVLATPRYHSFYNIATRNLRFDVPESDWGQSLLDLKRWLNAHPDVVAQGVAVLPAAPTFVEAYGLTPLKPEASPGFVAVSLHYIKGIPGKHRGEFVRIRRWKELQTETPVADFGGMILFRRDSIAPNDEPVVVLVNSWIDAMADPTLPPMRNFQERMLKGR